MPQQVPALAQKLAALGFEGDAQAFADLAGQPLGAVVSLGGCSASFVSPDGLIVTNHHCAAGSLQYNSTPQQNLLEGGFLAKTREEELWNGPGSKLWVTVSFQDVTQAITAELDPKLDDRKRYELVERRIKERTAACEASWAPLPRGLVLRGPPVLRDRAARDRRRAARVRPGRGHRRFRRRDRQLALAAPHRRLGLLPRLRRPGRRARAAREGERALQAHSAGSRSSLPARRRASSCSWRATPAARNGSRPTRR